MNILFAFIKKEFKLLVRDPGGFVMLFLLPAIFIFVLSIALQGTFSQANKQEKMDVLYINNDAGSTGEKLKNGLKEVGFFNIIEEINGKKLTYETAEKLVLEGKYKIIIHIPENATESLNFQEEAVIDIITDPTLNFEFATIITNTIQNFVQVSIITNIAKITETVLNEITLKRSEEINKQIIDAKSKKQEIEKILKDIKTQSIDEKSRLITEKIAQDNIKELDLRIKELEKMLSETNKNKIEVNENDTTKEFSSKIVSTKGLKVNSYPISSKGKDGEKQYPNSVQQNVPGWTIFALFWIVQTIAINIILERQTGAFNRIIIAPISKIHYLLGKIIPFFGINIIQAIFMFSIGLFILPLFGCPKLVINNFLGITLVTIAISFVAISIGLVMSHATNSLQLAVSLSVTILIILTVVGGIMVPKFIMPKVMQNISLIVPHSWALDGYQNLLVRNYSTIQVLPIVGVLLLFALIFFIISLFLINKFFKEN